MTAARAVVVTALLAASCGAPDAVPRSGVSPAAAPRYEVVTMVLENSSHPPELCVWSIAESVPPQCSGLAVTPFSWDDVEGEQSARGSTWLDDVRFVGTWDGSTFHVTEPPRVTGPRSRPAVPSPLPCPEPPGGWRTVDGSKTSHEAKGDAVSHARSSPDMAGIWVHWLREPTDAEARDGRVEWEGAVLVLTFTGDIDRHEREARERWGGALCVARRPHSYANLDRVGERLVAEARAAGVAVTSAGADERTNTLEVSVAVDDAATRQWVEERVDGVPVTYWSALTRLP